MLTLTVSGTVNYAQLELGDYPTSYIPTTGASVTRAVDNVVVNGFNKIGMASKTGLTLLFEAYVSPRGTGFGRYLTLVQTAPYSGDIAEILTRNAVGNVGYSCVGGAYVGAKTDMAVGQLFKSAVAYENLNSACAIDGALISHVTNSGAKSPVNLDNLLLGQAAGLYNTVTIKKVVLIGRRLTNSELIAATI